jgi:hypothetical protein
VSRRDYRIDRLKALERAELDAAVEEWARRELQSPSLRGRLFVRLQRWGAKIKDVATFVGAIGALTTAGAALYHRMRGTEVAPPQTPATGTPTITTDRVPEPRRKR